MRIEWRASDRASSTAVRNLHLGVEERRARSACTPSKVGARPGRRASAGRKSATRTVRSEQLYRGTINKLPTNDKETRDTVSLTF